ncbi:hypothetical protein HID58_048448, partial [Brassica napus]
FLIAAIYWIGTVRIRSKRSASCVPTAADRDRLKRRMDSPVSRSDSSSEPGEGSNCDLMAPLPLSYVNAAPPLVGPASSVGEDELAEWRGRYSLPYSVILRVPTREERASSYIPGEISVYEAFFDSSLRGTIPALIVGLCNLFEISPSKLNPPAWRILIATENLGDLEYLSLGINEFLFAYHLAPLNGGEGRFHLRPRSGLPIVEELRKSDWKGLVFNKKWQERYAFMMFPGSSYRWNFIGRNHLIFFQPKIILLLRKERELFSEHESFILLGSGEDDVCEEGIQRLGDDHRQPSFDSGKAGAFSISSRKETQSGGVTTRSAQQSADMARSAGSLAVALSNLNLNVFPQDGTVLPIGDPSEVVQVFQGGLLRTVSQLHHIRERLSSEDLPTLREEIEDLKRQSAILKTR